MLITMLPMTSSEASSGKRSASSHGRHYRSKRHSRAWWRRYRARQKRARIARLRRERLLAGRQTNGEQFANGNPTDRNRATATAAGPSAGSRGTWSLTMPTGWSNQPQMANGELNFRLNADGRTGTASLGVVGTAAPEAEANASSRMKRESLAGVPTGNLRRMVIDRMMREDGWVVNDYERELGGRKVFVVVGRVPGASGAQQSRLFYFTEVNGKIYSLTANVPVDVTDKVAADSEQVISAFNQSAVQPVASGGRP
jgi:hypothetical protein